MRTIAITNQFKRDHKKLHLETIDPAWIEVISKLVTDELLPEKYCDHQLTGNWKDHRDCHIKPDLVLIYRKYENELQLVRLGSHSELDL
jgi:mRNA interferase YafQ